MAKPHRWVLFALVKDAKVASRLRRKSRSRAFNATLPPGVSIFSRSLQPGMIVIEYQGPNAFKKKTSRAVAEKAIAEFAASVKGGSSIQPLGPIARKRWSS